MTPDDFLRSITPGVKQPEGNYPLIMNIQYFNPFASQHLVFEKKNEPFLLENAPNLTHEFLYDNFNKKILINFFVKTIIQKLMCQILFIFKEKWFIFFFKNKALRSEIVNSFASKCIL